MDNNKIQELAEKWAEDNCETIREVKEYNNSNDLQRGFIEGSKLAIDTHPLVKALERAIGVVETECDDDKLIEELKSALNNVQVVQPAKTDAGEGAAIPTWYTKEEMYRWLRQNKYAENIANELAEIWARDLQGAFTKGWEKAKSELHPDSVKGTPVSELICKKCNNGLVNEPGKPEKHDCAYCGGTGVNIDLMEDVLKKHSITFDEKGLLHDQPPLRIGELAIAIKDLIVTNPHTDKQEGMRWAENERYETRLALQMLVRILDGKPGKEMRDDAKKYHEGAKHILKKYFHISEVLRNESGADNGREAKEEMK